MGLLLSNIFQQGALLAFIKSDDLWRCKGFLRESRNFTTRHPPNPVQHTNAVQERLLNSECAMFTFIFRFLYVFTALMTKKISIRQYKKNYSRAAKEEGTLSYCDTYFFSFLL